jgi:hypothetical protein
VTPEIKQLEAQQALLTQALAGMLQGQWCGAPPSAQAFVSALDPGLDVQCTPPLLESDASVSPPGYLDGYNPRAVQFAQQHSWSCSACALAWLLRALGLDADASENAMIAAIGVPANINATYGLMDGSGAQLQRVLSSYGQNTEQSWLTFDSAFSIYSQTPGMMSGGAWYHWIGVRGVQDDVLLIANSARGYKGVTDTLGRLDFARLGPFSAVWCVP